MTLIEECRSSEHAFFSYFWVVIAKAVDLLSHRNHPEQMVLLWNNDPCVSRWLISLAFNNSRSVLVLRLLSERQFIQVIVRILLTLLCQTFPSSMIAISHHERSKFLLHSLLEIHFPVMSSHMEQSCCDMLSGFNHSKSQGERERDSRRLQWPFVF